jgi:hypothetical protein
MEKVTARGRELQFENGKLVKVDGARHQYMSGWELIKLVQDLAQEVRELKAKRG